MSHRTLEARQAAAWRNLLDAPPRWTRSGDLVIETYGGRGPREDLLQAGLAEPGKLFERVLPSNASKAGAVVYLDGLPVAHALLLNRANFPPAMTELGYPLGLLGACTHACRRGRGLAGTALAALDRLILAALADQQRRNPRRPVWLVAEPRILTLANRHLSLHVSPRPGVDTDGDPMREIERRRRAWRGLSPQASNDPGDARRPPQQAA